MSELHRSNGTPFKALGDPSLAYQCRDCNHISIHRTAIRRHCNKVHDWRYSKDIPVWWTEVYVQSFFEGFHQRYFIVQKDSAHIQSQISLTEEDEGDKAQILREFKEAEREMLKSKLLWKRR